MTVLPYLVAVFLSLVVTSEAQAVVRFVKSAYITEEGQQVNVQIEKEGTASAEVKLAIVVLLPESFGGNDFVGNSHALTFPSGSGQMIKSVNFFVRNDNIPETNETFTVSLLISNQPNVAKLGEPDTARITILANDDAFGIFSFETLTPLTVDEGRDLTPFHLAIERGRGSFGNITVTFQVTGSDDPTLDITPVSGSITFLEGETKQDLVLNVLPDSIPENDEKFTVTLTSVDNNANLNNTQKEVIIRANDAPVRFLQTEYRVDEGPSNSQLQLTVYRGLASDGQVVTGPTDRDAFVHYSCMSGSAQSNTDFLCSNGSVVFMAGEVEKSFTIQILADSEPEIAESFHVVLFNPSIDVVLSDPHNATVIIGANDDQHGILSLKSPDATMLPQTRVNEDTSATITFFTVVRSGGAFGEVAIDWEIVRNDSNTESITSDISPTTGTVKIENGVHEKAIVITVVQDSNPEPAELYLISLLANTVKGGARAEGILIGSLIMEDSDDAYGSFSFAPENVQSLITSQSPRILRLTILREGGTMKDVTVNYTVTYDAGGMTDTDVFIQPLPATVILSEGVATVTVDIPIKEAAFLKVGAAFMAKLMSAQLVTALPVGPFNSPRLGSRPNVSIPVSASAGNGEIGLANVDVLQVSEPAQGFLDVAVPLTREGTNGDATVFWTLVPSGSNAGFVTAGDTGPTAGSVSMTTGQSKANITIRIMADSIPETAEELTLTLTQVTPANTQKLGIGASVKRIVILENDNPGGIFEFAATMQDQYWVQEEGTTIDISVIRKEGSLVERSVEYYIEPEVNSELEFYGANNVMRFAPGETVQNSTILARGDGIPELDEMFTLHLRSFNGQPATIGERNTINITVRESDDPYGVIEFVRSDLSQTVLESKGSNTYTAEYSLTRSRGTFGAVGVSWQVEPSDKQEDAIPSSGTLTFMEGETRAVLQVTSRPDEIPEDDEYLTLKLVGTSGGAKLGTNLTSTLVIYRNDYAIYFPNSSVTVSSVENDTNIDCRDIFNSDPNLNVRGGWQYLTVRRNGPLDTEVKVKYRTQDGTAKAAEGDFDAISNAELIFNPGQREKTIGVYIKGDGVPETDETFYVILYEPEGDVVVYSNTYATIIIQANDDANGIFEFVQPFQRNAQEGEDLTVTVNRDRGLFEVVNITWAILDESTGQQIPDGTDFKQTTGYIVFQDQQKTGNIVVSPKADSVPEHSERFILRLTGASGGGPSGQFPKIGGDNSVTIEISANDDPYGVFAFPAESREKDIAEDYYPGNQSTTTAVFTIERKQGIYGTVEVSWEIFSEGIAGNLPSVKDLLFLGNVPSSVVSISGRQRPGTQTKVLQFSGNPGSYVTIPTEYQPSRANIETGFTMVAWLQPATNHRGYIIAKTSNTNNNLIYYGMLVQTNRTSTTLELHYSNSGISEVAYVTSSTVTQDGAWHHVLLTVDNGIAQFYLNGQLQGSRNLKAPNVVDGVGNLLVGAKYPGSIIYAGIMQDVRVFSRKLEPGEILELFESPSRQDVSPISGYLTYPTGTRTQTISVSSIQDIEEESNEVFNVKLISSKGGARVSENDASAKLTVLKSDNANGLFSFGSSCVPIQAQSEGVTISCPVERHRGDAGTVTVKWHITQKLSNGSSYPAKTDFSAYQGDLVFSPGDRSKTIIFKVKDDQLPELAEFFDVTLVSAMSDDGLIGTTAVSGASIDPQHKFNNISIDQNDYPYGLLQFSTSSPPGPDDPMIFPAVERPQIRVAEEVGTINLLVVRAQGLIGDVSVEWRTVDGTARSSGQTVDFQTGVDRLSFSAGQRYGFINITIIDNFLPEDDKYFTVELLNPTGGAEIGVGSVINVTISHSDNAYGIFQFDQGSLSLVAEEEGDIGSNAVVFEIVRSGGSIDQVSVTWQVAADPNNDIVQDSGLVVFKDGETRANLTIQVKGDVTPELDEHFVIELVGVNKGLLGEASRLQGNLTIKANDDPYGMFTMAASGRPVRTDEKNTVVTLTVERKNGLMGSVAVNYTTIGPNQYYNYLPGSGARADDTDFLPVADSVIFAAGQSSATFNITIKDDDIPEADEFVFVHLTNVKLVSGGQVAPVPNSPRLGPNSEIYGQVIINQNDDASGVLELSNATINIPESQIGNFINIVRTRGAFGEVTVKFEVIPGSATYGIDYSVTSTDVVLADGETQKRVPVELINDRIPELDETFTIRLLPQITGGARLGSLTSALVTILSSDDPKGAFEFATSQTSVDEPDSTSTEVQVTVSRVGGTLDVVAVQWEAKLNGQVPKDDISPTQGTIYFTSNQASETIKIQVLPDNIPEGQEDIQINLTSASNGGRIGNNNVFTLSILPNDNPHGTVEFQLDNFHLQEKATESTQYITLIRSGGVHGQLRVFYSTEQINVLAEATKNNVAAESYFIGPSSTLREQDGNAVDVTQSANPKKACLNACLSTSACFAFQYNSSKMSCMWYTSRAENGSLIPDSSVEYYKKNMTKAKSVYETIAKSGQDFVSVTGASVLIADGSNSSTIPLNILADQLPELDEVFWIKLTNIELVSGPPTNPRNNPQLGNRKSAMVTIDKNDDANGIFRIYSNDPRALDGGRVIEVEEREKLSVEFVVERIGGNIGEVSVTWGVDPAAGTATKDADYIADGATLTFGPGEMRRVITIGIQDDDEGEDDETFVIVLSNPQGGASVGVNNSVTVVIMASDSVAGSIGFADSSIIAKEGESVTLTVQRTRPGIGNVTVDWVIQGLNGLDPTEGFRVHAGSLFFDHRELRKTITLEVLTDDTPEINEEYRVVLKNIKTQGVRPTGGAVLDPQTYMASLTIQGSNEPHGVVSFAPSAINAQTLESNNTMELTVDRKFGAIGTIRVFYEVMSGTLSPLTQNLILAVDGEDFVATKSSIDLADGVQSGQISAQLIDDSVPEVDEVFLVNLTSVQLISPADSTFVPRLGVTDTLSQVLISANDGTKGEVYFAPQSANVYVNESAINVTLTVVRGKGTFGNVSVFYYAQSLGDGARPGADFILKPQDLHFFSGENSKDIVVQILEDDLAEPDEVFEVILASPKNGLEMGQPSKATITIATSDGAGGTVSFESAANITINEPEGSNTANSRAELRLVRGPGIYGVAAVPFVVIAYGNITDLTPTEGYVTFQDKSGVATLTLTAVADDIPEVDEMFMVLLGEPQSGARLGDITHKTVIIAANDAPYGLLQLYPSKWRNSTISVQEDVGLVHFDIVRSRGSMGRVMVDIATRAGSATQAQLTVGVNLTISTTQTIKATGLRSWYSFQMKGFYYAVMVNSMRRGKFNTTVGSDGAAGNIDSDNIQHSVLYKWQGVFIPVQSIETNGAVAATSFEFTGMTYMVMMNYGSPGDRLVNSRVYAVKNDGTLQVIQELPTRGARDVVSFSSNDQLYLVVANYIDNSGKTLQNSEMYQWDKRYRRFQGAPVQPFSTIGAVALAVFEINGDMYLAVANHYNSELDSYEIDSVLYKFGSNNRFTEHQTLPTRGAIDVEHFTVGVTDYLLIANHRDNIGSTVQNSTLYKWENDRFIPVQLIETRGIQKVHSYLGDNGGRLLTVSSESAPSSVMIWNDFRKAFEPTWQGDPASDLYPIQINQNSGQITLLVEAKYGGGSGVQESHVYLTSKLGDSDYVPRTTTMIFEPGQTLLTTSVAVLEDELPENTETFFVSLSNPQGGAEIGPDNEVTVNILANDNAYGIIEFAEYSLQRYEQELTTGDNTVQLNVFRREGTVGRVVVRWTATGDHDGINDITPLQGTIEFASGADVATITLTIKADDLPETDELTLVQLGPVLESPALIGTKSTARVVVMANDSPYGVVSWETASVSTDEPDTQNMALTLYVIREQGMKGDIQVSYITVRDTSLAADRQAVSGKDYQSKQGTVLLKENQAKEAVQVIILPDNDPEQAETFLVNITDVVVVGENLIGGAQPSVKRPGNIAVITINENDNARGQVQFNVTKSPEGRVNTFEEVGKNNILKLPISRTYGYFGTVTVTWQAVPISATTDDFQPSSGTVTLAEGERHATIDVTIIDDQIPEAIETFEVQILSVSGGASTGTETSVTVAIMNNDSPNGVFGFATLQKSVREASTETSVDGQVYFDVTRSQGSDGTVVVYWRVADIAAPDDFQLPLSGTLTFGPGEKSKRITLKTKPDNEIEGEERFTLSLTQATNNGNLDPTRRDATIVILPDSGASGIIEILPEFRTVVIGEPSGSYNGRAYIRITRGTGIYGEVKVGWQLTPSSAGMTDFAQTSGEVTFGDGDQTTEIILQAVNDNIPEQKSLYSVQLTSATEGATISTAAGASEATVVMVASDHPHGLFEFSTPMEITEIEFAKPISITVVRNAGTIGQVKVSYDISSSTATLGSDFAATPGSLTFSSGETRQTIVVNILEDTIPEGPEVFFVNLTGVELQAPSDNNYTVLPSGLQQDMPPAIGSLSVKKIIIDKNDNAEGVLEFPPEALSFIVQEDVGIARIPVLRTLGTYGIVTAQFTSRALTAISSVDYVLQNGEVTFGDGMTFNTINITIRDDAEREMAEQFELVLTGVTGGASLGTQLTATVTIAKSDFPNGKFGFEGQTEIVIPNPLAERDLAFTVSRTEGLAGTQTLRWRILGPNNNNWLEETNDIAYIVNGREMTSGQLVWNDGEGGPQSFTLKIKPYTGWEVQEIFIIQIQDIQTSPSGPQNGEPDPVRQNITLTVLKHGDPNGIVRFNAEAQQHRYFTEPTAEEGGRQVSFPIYRREGTVGNIVVNWAIQGDVGDEPDMEPMSGTAAIAAEKRNGEILLSLLPDDIPELNETFHLVIKSVEGGAEIDSVYNQSVFTIQYNDDPHGIFSVLSEYQTVIVDTVDWSRHVRINITRSGGSVGRVRVSYGIVYDQAQAGVVYLPSSASVTFENGQTNAILPIRMTKDVFLEQGSTFTLTLTAVNYIGVGVTMPPRLAVGKTVAKVTVPPEAANSLVGFTESVLTVQEVDDASGVANLTISRFGTYGSLSIDWLTGYAGTFPQGYAQGLLSPDSGTVTFNHEEAVKSFTVQVFTGDKQSQLFAVHLPNPPNTNDNVGGGARLRNGATLVEIEPSGVIGFSPDSRNVEINEENGELRLNISRLYGSEGNIVVRYSTMSVTGQATPGLDYTDVRDGSVRIDAQAIAGNVLIEVKEDALPEEAEYFFVNLTGVEKLPTFSKQGVSPRVSSLNAFANVTIRKNNDPYGVLSLVAEPLVIHEETTVRVKLTVFRTGGSIGTVSVRVRTVGGGELWDSEVIPSPGPTNNTIAEALGNRYPEPRLKALTNQDYEALDQEIILPEKVNSKVIYLRILNDFLTEPDESLFVYLTDPRGGARLATGARPEDGNKRAFATMTIQRSDNWNGMVGFLDSSLYVNVDEDESAMVTLTVNRSGAAYGRALIGWTAFGKDLADQLVTTGGQVICEEGQTRCTFDIQLKKDEIPEYSTSFIVELFTPVELNNQSGYVVNVARRRANVTMVASDYPDGLVQFGIDTKLKNAGINDKSVVVEVQRIKGKSKRVEVDITTRQVDSPDPVANVRVYAALEKADYTSYDGTLVFEPNVERQFVTIVLNPITASDNPYPKMFQVVLSNPTNGASLNPSASVANITIVDEDEINIWNQAQALLPQMTDTDMNNIINDLKNTISSDQDLNNNELPLTEYIIGQMIREGENRYLPLAIRRSLLNLLCELMSPTRRDETRGRFQLVKLFESFTYTYLTNQSCQTPDATDDKKEILMVEKECPHVRFGVGRWYPDYINGLTYNALQQNFFQVPITLLDTSDGGLQSAKPKCQDFHFIEYMTEQWFNKEDENELLSSKVLAFAIRDREFGTIKIPVTYRINADRRVTARRAQCVYYEETTQHWTAGNDICRVTNELNLDLGIDTYVDCECSHLSSYAVKSDIKDPSLVWYPIWFFVSCFIAMTGLALAILSHHICSIYSMFAANLLMHMCFATMATEICYVVAAYISPEIIVPPTDPDNSKCIIMGVFMHYFFLAQFTWMFTQAVNFWKILVMNDEHTDRKYVLFFLTGWGLPAILVAIFYVTVHLLYKYVYNLPEHFIYGDVNLYGEMCFVTNAYAALGGIVAPVLVCLFIVGVTFIHAFQVTPQWQAYDDVYRGRYNINEVRTILAFWAVITLTWLWGGLYMAYGELWMLIFFCIFNIILGLFAMVVYCALRNPCLPCFRPQKASYSLDLPGETTPDGMAYHPRAASANGSIKGSRASLINESWERDSVNVPNGAMRVKRAPASTNGNLYMTHPGVGKPGIIHPDEEPESQEFDDLIFALKTGGGFTPSETSHEHRDSSPGSAPGGSPGYEMRRISIADTHL